MLCTLRFCVSLPAYQMHQCKSDQSLANPNHVNVKIPCHHGDHIKICARIKLPQLVHRSRTSTASYFNKLTFLEGNLA